MCYASVGITSEGIDASGLRRLIYTVLFFLLNIATCVWSNSDRLFEGYDLLVPAPCGRI